MQIMLAAKARSCAHTTHGWQITQKAKLVGKKSKFKAKQTEIKPEKGQTFT